MIYIIKIIHSNYYHILDKKKLTKTFMKYVINKLVIHIYQVLIIIILTKNILAKNNNTSNMNYTMLREVTEKHTLYKMMLVILI